jgi:hypothetical protein
MRMEAYAPARLPGRMLTTRRITTSREDDWLPPGRNELRTFFSNRA